MQRNFNVGPFSQVSWEIPRGTLELLRLLHGNVLHHIFAPDSSRWERWCRWTEGFCKQATCQSGENIASGRKVLAHGVDRMESEVNVSLVNLLENYSSWEHLTSGFPIRTLVSI